MSKVVALRQAPPVPLYSLDAEQALLGAIFLNNDAWGLVSGFLRPEHFHEPVHRLVYELCGQVVSAGRRASPLTLMEYLPADLRIGDLDGRAYLARLSAEATTVRDARSYGETILNMAQRRALAGLGSELHLAAEDGVDLPDLVDGTMQGLLDVQEALATAAGPQRKGPTSAVAVIGETERRMASGERFGGMQSGLAGLDDKLGGFAPGEMILIAGRPSMGKSLLGLSLARRASRLGAGIAFISLEMSQEAVRQRLISDECCAMGFKIPYTQIRRGRLEHSQIAPLKRAAVSIDELPLWIADRGNRLTDLAGHLRSARRWLSRRGKNLDLIIIDYLGLVNPGDRYRGQRTNEVGEISLTLKSLAMREDLPLIALHQLNRVNEGRDDKRPRLSELRDSGSLEQDADIVMFVHRESYYLERPGYSTLDEPSRLDALANLEHKLEVIVAKQRHGPIGLVPLWCDMALNAVRDEAR